MLNMKTAQPMKIHLKKNLTIAVTATAVALTMMTAPAQAKHKAEHRAQHNQHHSAQHRSKRPAKRPVHYDHYRRQSRHEPSYRSGHRSYNHHRAKPRYRQHNYNSQYRYGHHSGYGYRGYRYHAPRIRLNTHWRGAEVFLIGGLFYHLLGGEHVRIHRPIGLHIHDLPEGVATLVVAGVLYYVLNDIYYRPQVNGGYKVVEAPTGHYAQRTAPLVASASTYRHGSKTAEQIARDQRGCEAWARDDSGYSGYGASATSSRYQHYRMTLESCLAERGYSR